MKLTDNLINELKEIYKERFISLILYGSCVTEDCDDGVSDINTIVIIDSLTAMDLKNASKAAIGFSKAYEQKENGSIARLIEFLSNYILVHCDPTKVARSPLPLFMDKQEWLNSCDVYPIEYSDIKARYKILYGEDIVAPLVLEKCNLRHQCEYEIKNVLIKLRQNYLGASNNLIEIEKSLKASARSFLALFRAILRLTNENVPFNHKEVIGLLAEKVTIDKDVFLKLLDLKTNSKAIPKKEYEITIQKLINSANEILQYVDKL